MFMLKFLGSTSGRWTRGIVGTGLLILGATLGGLWWILAAVGLVVAAAGILDLCLLAPLAHKPLAGPKFRASFAE
ncbi:hypothetical protein BH10ACT6_BH10ACT6_07630 [soil metagenome]